MSVSSVYMVWLCLSTLVSVFFGGGGGGGEAYGHEACLACTPFRGSGGMPPQKNIENLSALRGHLMASEALFA